MLKNLIIGMTLVVGMNSYALDSKYLATDVILEPEMSSEEILKKSILVDEARYDEAVKVLVEAGILEGNNDPLFAWVVACNFRGMQWGGSIYVYGNTKPTPAQADQFCREKGFDEAFFIEEEGN